MGNTKLNEFYIFGISIISWFFDVSIDIKIPFFRVLVTIDPSLQLAPYLQLITTNWLILKLILE